MSVYHNGQKVLNNITSVNEEAMKEIAKEVYSTEEQVVGTWIDGKPIYRKVISLNCPTCPDNGVYADATTDVSSLNIDFIMFKYVSISASNDTVLEYNGFIPNGAAKLGGQVWYYPTEKTIYARHTRVVFNNCPITAIIEYTKTTD